MIDFLGDLEEDLGLENLGLPSVPTDLRDDHPGYAERRDPDALEHDNSTLNVRQVAIMEDCALSRVYFVVNVLGAEPEPWQEDVLEALDNGDTRISIRSGNGAGKTALVAWIAIHYLLFRNDVKIPVTAPAASQLKDGLIPECHKWITKLPSFLHSLLATTSDRIVRRDSPENNFISFRTARKEKPEALAGIHATFVCCLVDEASAVDEPVYEAAQGTMSTPGAIFMMISNPTRLSGFFYNSHHRSKGRWRTFHVTSFDTSRVDQTFVDNIIDSYGKDSDQYRVKVLGNFPSREEESIIPKDLVVAAFSREVEAVSGEKIWGVDCGRGGDVSALAEREENVIRGLATQNYSDTMQTVGWVKAKWDGLPSHSRPKSIYVDAIGIGAGVADRLIELGLPAVAINVSELPSMKDKYPRLRDELWFNSADWFEARDCKIEGLTLMEQDALADELSAPIKIFTSTGKNGAETKPQLKARGIPSPNKADAINLTFAYAGAVGSGQKRSKSWDKPLAYKAPAAVW